jgi:hypothetical protein
VDTILHGRPGRIKVGSSDAYRDVLDAAQVPALKDLVQPLSVAISTGRSATTAGRPG